ncbi:phosphatidylserine/phosphatidylglycerophosphate/cardiolipin synthase family protein [Vampirovibrio sp.]|uniref:phospholipase D-like domain-containing protein n=1 Tax=Vampirovibrio sp. TaxID=2717857 RepID=UPI00359346C0
MASVLRQPIIFGGQGQEPQKTQSKPPREQPPLRYFRPPATDVFHYNIQTKNGVKKDQTIVESLLGGSQIFGKINEIFKEAENSSPQNKPWIMVNLYELQNRELYPERKCPPGIPGADIHASLLNRLIKLHTEGKAHVRVILDNSKQQPRTLHWDPTKPFKEQEKVLMEPFHNDRTISKLKAYNVPFVTYPNEKTLKNHVKLLLLNNRKAVVGGMNWGNHSAVNHDGAVYIEGPDVRNIFHKSYRQDWTTADGKIEEMPGIKPFHQGKIKVLQTSGAKADQGAQNEVLGEMLNQIHNAKQSIHAQLFVMTHKKVVNALIEKHKQLKAQGQEGVQLLVDEGLYKIFPNCRPGIQKLDDAGVPIRFYKENKKTEEKLHAKWAVFDRKHLLIGSANWSSLGLDSKEGTSKMPASSSDEESEAENKIPGKTNHEIAVMIENAPNVAGNFAKQADHDFSYQKGMVELSKPVSWNKLAPQKSWQDQPEREPWKPRKIAADDDARKQDRPKRARQNSNP